MIGGVWIVAGVLKLPDPAASVRAVRAYDLLPEAVVPMVGHLLPVVEVVVGTALVLGLLTRGGGPDVGAPVPAVRRRHRVGVGARHLDRVRLLRRGRSRAGRVLVVPLEIARDVGLLALSVFLVWSPRTRFALDRLLLEPVAATGGR